MAELLMKDEVFQIVGAAIEVHSELGIGFLEAIYQEAMTLELSARSISFKTEQRLQVNYKGQMLNKVYEADLICFGQIIVELKALERLTSREEAQLLNYLKATGFRVGLLINFGHPGKLEWKRMVR